MKLVETQKKNEAIELHVTALEEQLLKTDQEEQESDNTSHLCST